MSAFTSTIKLFLPIADLSAFFQNPHTWLRLNPEWAVTALAPTIRLPDITAFNLEICYDRSEQRVLYNAQVEHWEAASGFSLTLQADITRFVSFTWQTLDNGLTELKLTTSSNESITDIRQQTELALWLKSIADHLLICQRLSLPWRLICWLLNKLWLPLSPAGRRLVLLVLLLEGSGLLLLLVLVILSH